MSFLKASLRESKAKFTAKTGFPPNYKGNSPEFDAARQRWEETSTQDSILAEFTRYLHDGTPRWSEAFKPWEVKKIEQSFLIYANSDNTWNEQSLEAFLRTQVPQQNNCLTLLAASMPSLWALTVYFAQWPFHIPTAPSSLTLPALTRAIAFLCGRHSHLFNSWKNKDIGFCRSVDEPIVEYVFRALAEPLVAEEQSAAIPTPGQIAASISHRDVLDILNVTQPRMNEFTRTLSRDQLTPMAHRLAPPTPSELCELSMPTERLDSLLSLLIVLLDQANSYGYDGSPGKALEAAQLKVQNIKTVSFHVFAQYLSKEDWSDNSDFPLYDGIALLFNTFPNPRSLLDRVITNWDTGEEERLFVPALRTATQ